MESDYKYRCPYRNNCPDYATTEYCINNISSDCPNFEYEHQIFNFLQDARRNEARINAKERDDYE